MHIPFERDGDLMDIGSYPHWPGIERSFRYFEMSLSCCLDA
ncbi:hypothetical protein [Burkholderia pseudomallei]|nr:hypothetical protein [Burkholderia pseudomallei]